MLSLSLSLINSFGGPQLIQYRSGDRVGWGYCHGSCGTCTDCLRGQDLYCAHRQIYGSHNTHQGSFASAAVWDEDFLYKIPPTLSSVAAAPLMCAGAAVYSALHHAQVRPATRVGVLGVGGLGHLAVQFAAKMGCEVVVLSHTAGKKAEAIAYGASEFHVLDGDAGLAQLDRPLDCLLVTASQQPEWAHVLPLLRRGGTVSLMTVDPGEAELRVPYMDVFDECAADRGEESAGAAALASGDAGVRCVAWG